MIGVISSPGIYIDKTPRYEIGVYITDTESIPHPYHQRIVYNLKIGDEIFICGLNSTEKSGCWIAPDLYNFHNPSEKIRLAEVLIRHGYQKGDRLNLTFTHDTKTIELINIK